MNASRKGRKGRKEEKNTRITTFPLRSSRQVWVISNADDQEGQESKHLACETGTAVFGKPVHNSFDAIFKVDLAEVNQEAQSPIAQPQLGQYLFAVNPKQLLHRFQFDNYASFNQQIGAKSFIKNQFIVTDRNRHLPLDAKALFPQLMREGDFVNAFEQAGASLCVNFERCIENNFRELVFRESTLRNNVHRRADLRSPHQFSSLVSNHITASRKGRDLRVRLIFYGLS